VQFVDVPVGSPFFDSSYEHGSESNTSNDSIHFPHAGKEIEYLKVFIRSDGQFSLGIKGKRHIFILLQTAAYKDIRLTEYGLRVILDSRVLMEYESQVVGAAM
jgi:hypothetical protein